jgi:hypothetical protein
MNVVVAGIENLQIGIVIDEIENMVRLVIYVRCKVSHHQSSIRKLVDVDGRSPLHCSVSGVGGLNDNIKYMC